MFKYNLNIQIIIIALTRLITVRGATLNFLHVFSLYIYVYIYVYGIIWKGREKDS